VADPNARASGEGPVSSSTEAEHSTHPDPTEAELREELKKAESEWWRVDGERNRVAVELKRAGVEWARAYRALIYRGFEP
jgi:hypothetical protein